MCLHSSCVMVSVCRITDGMLNMTSRWWAAVSSSVAARSYNHLLGLFGPDLLLCCYKPSQEPLHLIIYIFMCANIPQSKVHIWQYPDVLVVVKLVWKSLIGTRLSHQNVLLQKVKGNCPNLSKLVIGKWSLHDSDMILTSRLWSWFALIWNVF